MTIGTVDPGIDVTGIAIWKPEFARKPTLQDANGLYGAAYGLVEVRSVRSKASDSTAERCRSLSRQLALVMARHYLTDLWIEIPPLWHAKRQKGRRTGSKLFDSLFKLNRAIGAAAAAVDDAVRIHERVASRVQKDARLDMAKAAARMAGKPEPENEDEASAVWIGLEVIAEMRWLAPHLTKLPV